MKILWLVAALLVLNGCSVPVWETVDDSEMAVPAATWQDEVHDIQFGLPDGLVLQEQTDNWKLYSNPNGDMEIQARRFLASDVDQAIRTISGFDAEQLTVLETSRYDRPMYRFSWLSQSEQGCYLNRACLVFDEMNCYALICSRTEEAGTMHEEMIRSVFSSFGLSSGTGI